MPLATEPCPAHVAQGLGGDSPRSVILRLSGAWGALKAVKPDGGPEPLARRTILDFRDMTDGIKPTELEALKAVTLEG